MRKRTEILRVLISLWDSPRPPFSPGTEEWQAEEVKSVPGMAQVPWLSLGLAGHPA